MIGISSIGANSLCSVLRISVILLGTTTTNSDRLAPSNAAGVSTDDTPCVAEDDDEELNTSGKVPGAP